MKRSRRYNEAVAQVDRERVYEPVEALDVLKSLPAPKFDESVEVVLRLGIDPRKSEQLVRGAVSLPNGLGKSICVVVFAEGDKADAAREAGADHVGSADLAITSPDMMKHVGKLGKLLGPQGKMPSPKSGTVTPDVAQAVSDFKAGKVEFRTDDGGNVHAAVGKRSFSTEALVENLTTFVDHVTGMRPATVKGTFVRRICVSTSMGPGLWISHGS